MLPGWYGFGSAVDAWLKENPDGMEVLSRMVKAWPFFRSLLSNMDMVLSKSDLAIASRYAQLVEDETLRTAIFTRIKGEWELTVRYLLTILGKEQLLAENPLLARSLRNRLPYMDPLNHLQVELLRRFRAGTNDMEVRHGATTTSSLRCRSLWPPASRSGSPIRNPSTTTGPATSRLDPPRRRATWLRSTSASSESATPRSSTSATSRWRRTCEASIPIGALPDSPSVCTSTSAAMPSTASRCSVSPRRRVPPERRLPRESR